MAFTSLLSVRARPLCLRLACRAFRTPYTNSRTKHMIRTFDPGKAREALLQPQRPFGRPCTKEVRPALFLVYWVCRRSGGSTRSEGPARNKNSNAVSFASAETRPTLTTRSSHSQALASASTESSRPSSTIHWCIRIRPLRPEAACQNVRNGSIPDGRGILDFWEEGVLIFFLNVNMHLNQTYNLLGALL